MAVVSAPDPADPEGAPDPGPRRPRAGRNDGAVPVLLLPGWLSSGPGHWQIRWADSHPDWQVVNFGQWEHPDPEAWQEALAATIRACPRPPLLIAHSLGCLATAGLLARPDAPTVAAALLVAPPDPSRPDTPTPLRRFHPVARRRFGVPGQLLFSSDDPYASEAFALEHAAAWGLESVGVGPLGHINADSGLGSWPEGLALVEALLSRVCRDI